jgi:hypothetical protein
MGSGNFMDASHETSSSLSRVCKDVKDLDKLYSMILELGKGKFCVNFCCCLVLYVKDMAIMEIEEKWILLRRLCLKNCLVHQLVNLRVVFCVFTCRVGGTRKGSFFCCHRFGNSGTCKFESLITVFRI